MFSYLVTYDGDKRKVVVSAKADFLDEVERVFATTILTGDAVKIRYEDPDWDCELVTVDSSEDLPDKAKVSITPKEDPIQKVMDITIDHGVQFNDGTVETPRVLTFSMNEPSTSAATPDEVNSCAPQYAVEVPSATPFSPCER